VEILQSCRVFNDEAFDDLADRQDKEARILLEHGKPIRFGPDGRKGLAMRNLEPAIVDLDSDSSVQELILVLCLQSWEFGPIA
jgi:2-oxoglutarate ferredoxin oxidoreductase subunit beta